MDVVSYSRWVPSDKLYGEVNIFLNDFRFACK